MLKMIDRDAVRNKKERFGEMLFAIALGVITKESVHLAEA